MASIVLVHGHMHAAWCWDRVVPLLEGAGHRVATIDLPGRGGAATAHENITLEDFARATCEVVAAQSEPVLLVGHSAGGVVLSEVAERMPERLARLVYAAAILLPDGESIFSAFVAKSAPDPSIAVVGPSAVKVDDAGLRRRFYNTSNDADAQQALARVCAEPVPPMMGAVHVTPGRFGRVKRAFIQTLRDNAVPIAQQRAMCAALPCDPVILMDTDHSPFLCRPGEFAAHLDALTKV